MEIPFQSYLKWVSVFKLPRYTKPSVLYALSAFMAGSKF